VPASKRRWQGRAGDLECNAYGNATPLGATLTIADQPHWHANLDLSFAQAAGRTGLASKAHQGPLQVQKALYPEGPRICHVTVLHPPGGIAAGDSLSISARLDPGSHVCLTTPGAAKWYRCPSGESRQQLRFAVAAGGVLEWLPRENILFDASQVCMNLDVELAPSAHFLGWEILCFGRRASGEQWRRGGLRLSTRIARSQLPLWRERAVVTADGGFASSPVGLAGYSVSGTLVCAGSDVENELLEDCRSLERGERDARSALTRLPGVLLARYLGHSSQDAHHWFAAIWKILRPALLGATATAPRLWAC
jgi:urease accessory protein